MTSRHETNSTPSSSTQAASLLLQFWLRSLLLTPHHSPRAHSRPASSGCTWDRARASWSASTPSPSPASPAPSRSPASFNCFDQCCGYILIPTSHLKHCGWKSLSSAWIREAWKIQCHRVVTISGKLPLGTIERLFKNTRGHKKHLDSLLNSHGFPEWQFLNKYSSLPTLVWPSFGTIAILQTLQWAANLFV